MARLTSCRTKLIPGFAREADMFASVPVMRLSTQTTSQPSLSRRRQRCDPRNPAPPVTTARPAARSPEVSPMLSAEEGGSAAADASIDETEVTHLVRFPDISAVDDHGASHAGSEALQVDAAKLIPLRQDSQGVRLPGHPVRVTGVGDTAVEDVLGLGHGHRVVHLDLGPPLQQSLDDFDRGRLAEVIRVGLVAEAQDPDPLAPKPTEQLL